MNANPISLAKQSTNPDNDPNTATAKELFERGRKAEHGMLPGASIQDAAKYYRKAALLGYAPAQNAIGFCHVTGQGVKQSDSIAAAWFKSAADQGFEPALINYGALCLDGKGVEHDIEKGKDCLCLAILSASQHSDSSNWMEDELFTWIEPMVNP